MVGCRRPMVDNIHNFVYFFFEFIGISPHLHEFARKLELFAIGWSVRLVYEELVVDC